MNVLIIGGTRFVGRHIAQALAERGHAVTLFNRGSNPAVHEDLEQIHGDRASDLHRLDARHWGAVIDTSGYTPNVVETSARYFAQRTNRYVFISTVSVYDHERTDGPDEDAPVMTLPEGADPNEYNVEYYGALKALCEEAVRRSFGDRATILRPGLVAGPHDPTDRFTYWPVRFDDGGDVLAPMAENPIQYIDARDLAAFTVRCVEDSVDGIFNCVTPRGTLAFGDLYEAALHEAAAEDGAPLCVPDGFLAEHGVQPWSELPLWVPRSSEYLCVAQTDSARAAAAGLSVRPLRETVRDTLAWARQAEKHVGALQAGLAPQREAELLEAARAAGLAAVK